MKEDNFWLGKEQLFLEQFFSGTNELADECALYDG